MINSNRRANLDKSEIIQLPTFRNNGKTIKLQHIPKNYNTYLSFKEKERTVSGGRNQGTESSNCNTWADSAAALSGDL